MNQKKNIEAYLPSDVKIEEYENLIAYEIKASDILDVAKNLHSNHKLSLKVISCTDERKESGFFKIFYIFGVSGQKVFIAPYIRLKDGEKFPSIVDLIHQASGYERRLKTFFGLSPEGHPSLRPIILHENWPDDIHPLRKDFDWQTRPQIANTPYDFRRLEGEGVYEIPVGPVHAGIIEPGHFRFSIAGEEILQLEPKLGYKHKGIEKLFEVLPFEDKLRLSERVSGDSSFSHSLAYCQAIETLGGIEIPVRAGYLRVIFAELERLANHFGDLGAMMLDTGFNFGGSNGARLREMVMQWNERLTGSRFLRGVNAVGGVKTDIASDLQSSLASDLEKIKKDFTEVINIAENSSSVLNRLKGTGTLDFQIAYDHGTVGVAARAVGMDIDSRIDFPYAAYDKFTIEIANEADGDAYARFHVRVKEAYSSLAIIKQALEKLPAVKEIRSTQNVILKKKSYAISLVEGWRGEIAYFVATDQAGNISRVEPRDPSFLNWTVMGYAGKGNVVPDFPLINKSFNLSYSGNDL
jgi:Ni,Fe-hydrogenase III large subunit/Ni,Fe-hydrogenase III component G